MERPLSKAADGEIRDAQRRIRTTKMDPDGNSWAPWSYNTLKQRQRRGNTQGGILYRTGFLLRSFAKRVTNRKMEVTNTAPYAKYHQRGTSKMPARVFLGFSDSSVRRITRLIRNHLRS